LVVAGGTLVVNGSIYTNASTVVNSGATIMGSGYVSDLHVLAGGTVNPGNSTGTLYTDDFNLDGTFIAEINGSTPGLLHDQIHVYGAVTLNGLLALSMSEYTPNIDGFSPVNGTFSGLDQGAEFDMAGVTWQISYTANSDLNSFTGGNDVAIMAMEIIPEPSSLLLLSLSTFALLIRRR